MQTEWEGRIAGQFEGYLPGRVYELSDGSRWKQEDRTDEPVYRENPQARLLKERGAGLLYLDVEGTSAMVRVIPDQGMSGLSSRTY